MNLLWLNFIMFRPQTVPESDKLTVNQNSIHFLCAVRHIFVWRLVCIQAFCPLSADRQYTSVAWKEIISIHEVICMNELTDVSVSVCARYYIQIDVSVCSIAICLLINLYKHSNSNQNTNSDTEYKQRIRDDDGISRNRRKPNIYTLE